MQRLFILKCTQTKKTLIRLLESRLGIASLHCNLHHLLHLPPSLLFQSSKRCSLGVSAERSHAHTQNRSPLLSQPSPSSQLFVQARKLHWQICCFEDKRNNNIIPGILKFLSLLVNLGVFRLKITLIQLFMFTSWSIKWLYALLSCIRTPIFKGSKQARFKAQHP